MEEISTEPNKIEESKADTNPGIIPAKKPASSHHYFVYICGVIALLLLGFIGGQSFERARIRHFIGWADNYERNFFDKQPMMPHQGMRELPPPSFRSFGIPGRILSIEAGKISIQENNTKREQVVTTSDSTVILHNNDKINTEDLKPDQSVAVFGRPNSDGQIDASLIRVLDDSFINIRVQGAATSPTN